MREHIVMEYEDSVCCLPFFLEIYTYEFIFQYYGYPTDSSACLVFTNGVYLLSLLSESTD